MVPFVRSLFRSILRVKGQRRKKIKAVGMLDGSQFAISRTGTEFNTGSLGGSSSLITGRTATIPDSF
jgi:hypothetical protein